MEQPGTTQNDQANVVDSKPSSSKYTENKSSQIVHIILEYIRYILLLHQPPLIHVTSTPYHILSPHISSTGTSKCPRCVFFLKEHENQRTSYASKIGAFNLARLYLDIIYT